MVSMLTIYKKATRVIVWLGPHGMHTQSIFRGMEAIDTAAWQRYCPHEYQDLLSKKYVDELFPINLESGDRSLQLCDSCSRILLEGLEDLMKRPWYNRVWVKQEIWATHTVRVVCGDNTFHWELLSLDHGDATIFKLLLLTHNSFRFAQLRQRHSVIEHGFPKATPSAFALQ